MSTINKILSGLILLTAIAACILSTLLYQQRIELRNRADYLSKVTAKTAKVLDSQGELATEMDISTHINEETLNWKSYKAARNEQGLYTKWEQNVDQFPAAAEKIITMKENMAEQFLTISQQVDLPIEEGDKAALNSTLTVDSQIDKITNRISYFKEQKQNLQTGLNELARATNYEKIFDKLPENKRLKSDISQLVKHSAELYNKQQLLAKNVQALAENFDKDKDGETLFSPSWTEIDFIKADTAEMRRGFQMIIKDLQLLNTRLYELKVANKLVEEQRTQLAVKDNVIEEINRENDQLKNINGSQNAQIQRISLQLADYKKREIVSIPDDIQAEVVEVNDRFNFLVINKGRDNGLMAQAELLIHNNGQYICKARISKVLKDKAVCDILPNPGALSPVKIPVKGNTAVAAR
ncbi:MAG: hypothetical protein MK132_02605 [Lentisphaerales bacterium]|nr:hypothetical protein [Lentisphaerales bacterium]